MRTGDPAIIKEFGVKPTIDPKQEIAQRTAFLEGFLAKTGLGGFVLGISGGQDSLLAGILAERAVRARRAAGHEAVFQAVLLPYGTQADREDALLACDVIHPDEMHDLPITTATDALSEVFRREYGDIQDFHKGNIKARERMAMQYLVAGQCGLSVIGTDHAAEAITGFFTKYGDGGADVLPLSRLNKRQGRALLTHLDVPERFITKPPTADLLDQRPAQPDETELGFTYDDLDDYLEGKAVDDAVADNIEARYHATQHKRELPVSYAPE